MAKSTEFTTADECPKCGALSYQGGYCFGCGAYRPSKPAGPLERDDLDTAEFMEKNFGSRVGNLDETEEQLDERLTEKALRRSYGKSKGPRWKPSIRVIDEGRSTTALVVQALVESYGQTAEGSLIKAVVLPWRSVIRRLEKDWSMAFQIPPRIWEEMIAAAFDQEGYDEVTLTPRSKDRGRDVIAVKHGIGCIRIIDSVKAYKPSHLVKHDDVRALLGVLSGDLKASKGIVTTTSDFAPGIATDPLIAPFVPTRLELMNGEILKRWLTKLSM
jgi:restriction system protein